MDVIEMLGFEVRGFLFLLASVLLLMMLTGRIRADGLLTRKDGGRPRVSPERVQLLLATLALSAMYVREVVRGRGGVMPDVSARWLSVFGGSCGIYVLVKAWTALRSTGRTEREP